MAYDVGDTLVRAVMQNDTGLPEDVVMNDFAFKNLGGAPTNAQVDDMFARVDDFYRESVGALAVGAYISSSIDRAATHELQAFHIVAGSLGSPFYTAPWLGPVAPDQVNQLPTECAAVLSFHAELTGQVEIGPNNTRPRARRRGRIYVGPLTLGATTYFGPNPGLDLSFRSILGGAAVRLMDDSTTDGAPWCVWSRTDQAVRGVVGGWVDNAVDTQRRRGTAATARATWG